MILNRSDLVSTALEINRAKSILIATTVGPAIVGIVAIVLLVLIHLQYPEVRKPFTVLILGVSIGDMIHFVTGIFLEPLGISQMERYYNPLICKIAGAGIILSHMYTGLAQSALAFDRYLQIIWRKSLTAKQRLCIIFVNVLITVVTTIPCGMQDAFGGMPGVTCVVDMRRYNFAINSGALFMMAYFYLTTLLCSIKVLLYLKSYSKQRQLTLGQQIHLRDNRDISKLVLMQTFLALTLQPMTVIMYILDGIITGIPQWLRFSLILAYYITPTLNSWLVLYIIKPYREAVMSMITKRVTPVLVQSIT